MGSIHSGSVSLNFGRILPPSIKAVEGLVRDLQQTLPPAEDRIVQSVVPKRRREFIAGRTCARYALARFGLQDVVIPVGQRREPLWPVGIVGSITHTDRYCAAAVASVHDVAALGIDVESNAPIGRDLANLICTDNELRQWQGIAGSSECFGMLVFSIKESIYKALSPMMNNGPGFRRIEVAIGHSGRFHARAVNTSDGHLRKLLDRLEGAFTMAVGQIFTGAWITGGGP